MLIFLHPPLAGSGLLARIKAAFFYLHRRRSVLFLYPHLPYLPFFFFYSHAIPWYRPLDLIPVSGLLKGSNHLLSFCSSGLLHLHGTGHFAYLLLSALELQGCDL